MIINGNTQTISSIKTLPIMTQALFGWFQNIVFTVVSRTVVDHVVQKDNTPTSFYGVIQPMGPEQLKVKTEGERTWPWYTIYATPDLILKTGDIMTIESAQYKVMQKEDWQRYGYVKYDTLKDYQP